MLNISDRNEKFSFFFSSFNFQLTKISSMESNSEMFSHYKPKAEQLLHKICARHCQLLYRRFVEIRTLHLPRRRQVQLLKDSLNTSTLCDVIRFNWQKIFHYYDMATLKLIQLSRLSFENDALQRNLKKCGSVYSTSTYSSTRIRVCTIARATTKTLGLRV